MKEDFELGKTKKMKNKQDLSAYIKNKSKYDFISEKEAYARNFDIRRFPAQKKANNYEEMKYSDFYQECRDSLLDMRHDHSKEFRLERYVPLESLAEQILVGNNLKQKIKLKPIFGLKYFQEAMKECQIKKSSAPLVNFLKNNKEKFFEYFT